MRLVLLKSQKFANQAGYYLQNGRWHKTSQDKPAPKGAPVSAHPHAAGKPVQKETLADHEWGQLSLPAENVNAKTFNKQLDQLKAAAAAGDVTGIVGSGYGTNTYGKKLVIIANHVLGLLGSDHKVTPGQKAGTHAAVQTAPEIEAGAPAPKPEEPAKAEPKPAPEQEKPASAPEPKKPAELAVPDFSEGKQAKGVKAHYEKVAKKVIRAAKAGDQSALQFMMKPESGNTWKGKTDNSKKLLALHKQAVAHVQGNKPAGKDVQHPDAEKNAAQEAKELAKEKATPKPEPKPAPEPEHEKNPKPEPEPDKPEPKGDAASKLSQIPWDGMLLPDSNKNAKSHNNQVAKIKAMAEAGDIEGLKNFKAGVNTYGKKQNLLAQTALAALEESAPAPKAEGKPAEGLPKLPDFKDINELKTWMGSDEHKAWHQAGMAKYGDPAAWEKSQELQDLANLSASLMNDWKAKNAPTAEVPKPPKFTDFQYKVLSKMWVTFAQNGQSKELMDSINTLTGNVQKTPEKFIGPDGTKLLQFASKLSKWATKNMAAPDGEPASVAPAADGKPQKPTDLKSVHWKSTVDEIEKAIEEKNTGYLDDQMFGTDGLTSEEAKKVHAYAKAGLEHVTGSSSSTENDGPMEGETKQGADGMLVFKNGRWHKIEDKASQEKSAPSGPADVAIPAFNHAVAKNNTILTNLAEGLKAAAVEDGAAGLKKYLTNHKDGSVTAYIPGIANIKKTSIHSATPAFAEFAKFVDELKASVKTKAGKKAKPKAEAPAAPAPEPVKQIESMDGWEQTGGQGGSNPGGKFKDENGVEWYCKFPENDHIAKAEVLAAKLYSALGLNAQDAKLITKDGKVGIASRWVNVKKATPKELAQTPGVLAGFAADAWLANWDVVGLANDNLQVDDQGHAMRVDAGGSLMYRAQGSKKAFGEHVTELDSLRDTKMNPQAAAVFGKMTKADITASVAKVAQLSDAQIRIIVNANGPGDKAERKALADTLIARKNDLIAKYPKSVKPTKKRLDPTSLPVKEERLPKIHDFANWNGPGSGLSSKAPVNNANQKVEDEMLDIAKSGNLTKLKDFKYQPVDIATGDPKGEPIPVGQHPSKHVQQFHQDLIQALDEIANPPQPLKIFQESDLSTLDELDTAFPSKKFGTTVNSVHSNEKMGFWVVLGGVQNAAEKFMPKKISHFTTSAIEAAYGKFKEASKLAKHFVHSVQASGSYNDLFREGKEMDKAGNKLSDVAKAALEFATEQPEGTTVYRWQQMTKDMIDKIMGAPDGTVFQATGPMCTSMSPTATSHFGPHRIKISYAKGAKAVESFGSGAFATEKEVTTLPNARFVIVKKEMVPSANGTSKRLELEVLMLPPDLGL